jgi:galactonate dehydratase
MPIDTVEALVVDAGPRPWLFVEIRTTDGVVGVGEGSQSRVDRGVVTHVERLASRLRGRDPQDAVNSLVASLATDEFAGRASHAATSATEQALWDVIGKQLGVPCWRLFGGRVRDRVRAYANLALATASDHPDAFAHAAARAVAAGFSAIKIYPLGNFAGRDAHAGHRRGSNGVAIRAAVSRVRAARDAVGPDVDVLIDCSWSLRDADAVALATLLDDLGPYWLEEPFPGSDPQQLRDFRRRVNTRVAAGEQSLRPQAFRRLLEHRAVDVVMPDVKWVGGISTARAVAQMADAWDVEVSPHNMSGPIATAASAVVAGTSRATELLELPFADDEIADLLVGGDGVQLDQGHVVLDERPGLGVGWDPAAARRLGPPRT